jgi:hypothetical protein
MTETQARAAKARKLAHQLRLGGITGDLARRMTEREWWDVARLALCHPPHSQATKDAVYELLDDASLAWEFGWEAITDVPCMFRRCSGTIRWAENGYVPGYRICDACGRHYQFTRAALLGEEPLGRRSIRHNGRRSHVLPDGRVSFFVPWDERQSDHAD